MCHLCKRVHELQLLAHDQVDWTHTSGKKFHAICASFAKSGLVVVRVAGPVLELGRGGHGEEMIKIYVEMQ